MLWGVGAGGMTEGGRSVLGRCVWVSQSRLLTFRARVAGRGSDARPIAAQCWVPSRSYWSPYQAVASDLLILKNSRGDFVRFSPSAKILPPLPWCPRPALPLCRCQLLPRLSVRVYFHWSVTVCSWPCAVLARMVLSEVMFDMPPQYASYYHDDECRTPLHLVDHRQTELNLGMKVNS